MAKSKIDSIPAPLSLVIKCGFISRSSSRKLGSILRHAFYVVPLLSCFITRRATLGQGEGSTRNIPYLFGTMWLQTFLKLIYQ